CATKTHRKDIYVVITSPYYGPVKIITFYSISERIVRTSLCDPAILSYFHTDSQSIRHNAYIALAVIIGTNDACHGCSMSIRTIFFIIIIPLMTVSIRLTAAAPITVPKVIIVIDES